MKQIDWDIIERKTEGTLSPEEEELFQAWLDDDPAHGAYFRKVEAFHRAVRPLRWMKASSFKGK